MLFLFRCESCGHQARVDDRNKEYKCYCEDPPHTMVRVYSFAGTVFKGDGFYRTDKRKDKKPDA